MHMLMLTHDWMLYVNPMGALMITNFEFELLRISSRLKGKDELSPAAFEEFIKYSCTSINTLPATFTFC